MQVVQLHLEAFSRQHSYSCHGSITSLNGTTQNDHIILEAIPLHVKFASLNDWCRLWTRRSPATRGSNQKPKPRPLQASKSRIMHTLMYLKNYFRQQGIKVLSIVTHSVVSNSSGKISRVQTLVCKHSKIPVSCTLRCRVFDW